MYGWSSIQESIRPNTKHIENHVQRFENSDPIIIKLDKYYLRKKGSEIKYMVNSGHTSQLSFPRKTFFSKKAVLENKLQK